MALERKFCFLSGKLNDNSGKYSMNRNFHFSHEWEIKISDFATDGRGRGEVENIKRETNFTKIFA